MSTSRLHITIPKNLFEELKSILKSGETSAFISNLIKEKLREIKKEKLKVSLAEGYKKRNNEDKQFARTFKHLDSEGLDDY